MITLFSLHSIFNYSYFMIFIKNIFSVYNYQNLKENQINYYN